MNRPPPLVRLLDRRTRALKRQLAVAVAGKDTGVHQARVASRRLREALPVLTEGLHQTKAGKARRKIRKLTGALGTVRELDVTLHLVDALADRQGIPRPALAEVRAEVMEAREQRRGVMLKRLEGVDQDKLGHRLAAVRRAVALAPAGAHAWRAALAVRIARRARRLEKAIADAGQIYAPESLHEVRIAAKKLRYALEIADETVVPCRDVVRTIKRVQDTLGRLHDLQVLQHHVAAVGAAPRHRRSTPDAGLAILSRLIEDECRLLHGRYVASHATLREAVARARHDIPVRLTARGRAARPVKMALPARRRASGS